MQDLETHPPSLIIAHATGGYAPNFDVPVDQLAAECHCQGAILDGFKAFSAYVKENYSSELMFDGAFRIYRPLGS